MEFPYTWRGNAAATPAPAPQLRERLDSGFFLLMVGAALLLHVAALVAWQMAPKLRVVDVPVRVLNIKLGDADGPEEAAQVSKSDAAGAGGANGAPMQANTESEMEEKTVKKQPDRNAAPKALDKAISHVPTAVQPVQSKELNSDSAHQFVRENSPAAKAAAENTGSKLGNSSARDAEMIARYEQLISLWIQKFKIYPDEARAKNIEGQTIVRIRIDRSGNIRYYILEYSTGSPILDRAATDMIRRANPVPAVPKDYPPDELIEFLIPVTFRLQ